MLNKAEKAVEQYKLDQEKAVLKELERHYEYALEGINERLRVLQAMPETQSTVYHKEYQQVMKKQVTAILENLHSDFYSSLDQYRHDAYNTGFVGTMYDLHYQNVPLLIPINRDAVLRAVQHETKLTSPLYDELGIDIKVASKKVSKELSRGLSSGLTYDEIARNIRKASKVPLSRAKGIARTEGHRIQQASSQDAAEAAKAKGADIVKQWDATLDGDTRPNHRQLDGQIRELEEPFEVGIYKPMHPGDFGTAGEDCNCRCVSLKRARWELDEEELEELKKRAEYFGLDKSAEFADFEKKYLKAAGTIDNSGKIVYNSGAVSGAYNDSNDPDGAKRDAHAELYYASLRNSKKKNVVETIARNAGVEEALVSRMYDHLLVNEYDLDDSKKRFDASYEIAQSLQRLREGKNIQEHDIILIHHESTEYLLMNRDGMSYDDAHNKANEDYDYATALRKFLKQKDGE